MQYKVGDKVRVKSKEWYDKQPKDEDGSVFVADLDFTSDMAKYCGEVARVEKIYTDTEEMHLDIDSREYFWRDWMLEPVDSVRVCLHGAYPSDYLEHTAYKPVESMHKDKYYEGFAFPRHKLHRDLLDKMHETYKSKNAAYGNSFDRSIDKYGYTAALVRIEDKKNRLDQLLLEGGAENDEAIEDTCLDMANYSIMLTMYLLEKKGNAESDSE